MSTPVETPERRVTVEEYHRMAEAGILPPDERVELLWGVVCRMSPKNWAHVVAANRICDLFRRHLEGRARVYKEDPLFRSPSTPSPSRTRWSAEIRISMRSEPRT